MSIPHHRLCLNIDDDDKAALDAVVASQKLPKSEVIRQLIRKANRELAKASRA